MDGDKRHIPLPWVHFKCHDGWWMRAEDVAGLLADLGLAEAARQTIEALERSKARHGLR